MAVGTGVMAVGTGVMAVGTGVMGLGLLAPWLNRYLRWTRL
jgi:hypothetical protein